MSEPVRLDPQTKRALLPGAILLLALAGSARGQTRPLQTEEATTAGAGRIALEAGVVAMSHEPSFLTLRGRERWDVPRLNLVYSPAANVEIDLEWPGRVIAVDDPDFGTVSDWGDVTLRAKLRFAGDRKGRPAIAARFAVSLPQTSHALGLGPNTNRASVQVLLTKSLGRLAAHANLGLAIHDQVFTPHAQHDLLAYGLALQRSVGARFTLLGEVAGRAGKGDPVIDRTHEVRAGLRYARRRLAWDAALRRGLSAADGEWGFTAGLAWTARAPRQ